MAGFFFGQPSVRFVLLQRFQKIESATNFPP